jgi:hypothetical protein
MTTTRRTRKRADDVVCWHNTPLLEIGAQPIVLRVRNSPTFGKLRHLSSEFLESSPTFKFTRFARTSRFKWTLSPKRYKVSLQGASG